MAKYSVAKYGVSLYGEEIFGTAEGKYEVPFTATANWYYSVYVQWGTLNNIENYSHWRLVRSTSGVPDTPYDAEVLISGEYDPLSVPPKIIPTNFTDSVAAADFYGYNPTTNLIPNTEVTYSLWLFNPSIPSWNLVGHDTAFIVSQASDTLRGLLRSYPGSWTTLEGSPTGYLTGEPEVNDLAIFLSGPVFYYDELKAKVFNLSLYGDPVYTPNELLRTSVLDLGFDDEPILGDAYNRSLFKVGNFVNAYRGTALGVKVFTSALTHWGNQILPGTNMFLETDDASFETGTGNWTTVAGVLTQKEYSNFTTSSNSYGRIITPPDVPFERTDNFYHKVIGFGELALTASTAEVRCVNDNDVIGTGFKVDKGKSYTFSIYIQHGNTEVSPASVQLFFNAYNKDGDPILGENLLGSPETISNSWTKHSLTKVVDAQTDLTYIVPGIGIGSGVSGQNVILDMMYFGESLSPERFEDSRKTKVSVFGERENLLPNPNFEHGVSGWYALNALSTEDLCQEIDPPSNALYNGTSVAKVTADSTDLSVSSSWIAVNPNTSLTFSSYVFSSTDSKQVKVRLEFSTPLNMIDQAKIVNGEFVIEPYYVDSDIVTLSNSSLSPTRISVTAITPDVSVYAIKPSVKASIIFPDSELGDVFYIDSCLLEHTSYVKDYFDGDGAPFPINPNSQRYIDSADCSWEYGFITNYISNPNFSSNADDWTGVTYSSSSGKFGAGVGLVSTTASISATLPTTVPVGSLVTFSAYVKSQTPPNIGVYTTTLAGDLKEIVTKTESTTDSDWVRLSITGVIASLGSITEPVISASIESDGAFIIDGVQLEVGNYATAFTGPGVPGVVSEVNGSVYTHSVWGSLLAGRSYFWNNFGVKAERLALTLNDMFPFGSNWEIVYGDTTYRDTETNSLVTKMYSFDGSVKDWSLYGPNSLYYTSEYVGSLASDTPVEGTSFAVIEKNSADNILFICDNHLLVSPDRNYHACIAVKSDTTITVDFNIHRHLKDSVASGILTQSKTLSDPNVWYYIDINFNSEAYNLVHLSLGCDDALDAKIFIDRVILRPA